jgi:hypothetical protein
MGKNILHLQMDFANSSFAIIEEIISAWNQACAKLKGPNNNGRYPSPKYVLLPFRNGVRKNPHYGLHY